MMYAAVSKRQRDVFEHVEPINKIEVLKHEPDVFGTDAPGGAVTDIFDATAVE